MAEISAILIGNKTSGRDSEGYPITESTRKEVICEAVGTNRNEFYLANRSGKQISLTLHISAWEYERESLLEYDGKIYNIVRTFPINSDTVELICEAVE